MLREKELKYFYPRSPCGERHTLTDDVSSGGNFYPRSPCGERPNFCRNRFCPTCISIHALLAESDSTTIITICTVPRFLSTLSLRRATFIQVKNTPKARISIHALLAESDGPMERGQVYYINFYPRSPCGERLSTRIIGFSGMVFLSTLSLRRATVALCGYERAAGFLSTLSLRRATAKVHKTVGHFCAYETNFMEIASSC